MRIRLAAFAVAALLAPAIVQAADLTPVDFVNRHLAAAGKGDVDAIVADYADNAVLLTAGKATQGKAAIRANFAAMLGPGAPKTNLKPIKIWSAGDVGFVSWEAGPVKGADSFLIHDGKIVAQAVFIGEAVPQ